ncbi:MAG: hypothetical protein IJS32_04525 [Kiritimatiellae bacterium]|nr:hypothetical protein [Kiritimatiellia bacterium]
MKKLLPFLSAVLLAACTASAALSPWWGAELRGIASLDSTFDAVATACGAPELAEAKNFADDFRAFAFDSEGVLDLNRSIRFAYIADRDAAESGLAVLKLPTDDASVYLASLLEKCAEAEDADLTAFPSGARALRHPGMPAMPVYAVPRDDDMLLLFPVGDFSAVLDFPAIATALAALPPILPVQGLLAVTVFDLEAILASESWEDFPASALFPPESAATTAACKEFSWGLAYDAGVASLYMRCTPGADSPYAEALKRLSGPGDALVRAFRFPEALFAAADSSAPLLDDGTDPRNEAAIAGMLSDRFPALAESLADDFARLAAKDPIGGESAFALLPPLAGNLLRVVACHQLKDAAAFRTEVESFLARAAEEDGNPHGLAFESTLFGGTPVTRVTLAEPLFAGCPRELLLAWNGDRVVLSTAGEAACARALTLLEYPSPAAPALREEENFAALFADAPAPLCTIGFGDLGDLVAAYLPFCGAKAPAEAPASCRAGYASYVDGDDLVGVFRCEVAGLPSLGKQLSAIHDAFACTGSACGNAETVAPAEETDADGDGTDPDGEETGEEPESLDDAAVAQAIAGANPAFAEGDAEEIPADAAETAEAAFEADLQAAREAAEIPESAVK